MLTVNVFYIKMVNWAKQEHGFKNYGHELNYGIKFYRIEKYLTIILFKYIIPKYLMRIWINGIKFERV
jgi:hypothetical protein